MQVSVVTFYKFVSVEAPSEMQRKLYDHAKNIKGLRGTILLAEEGINGTIAGRLQSLESMVGAIRAVPAFADLECKYSYGNPDNPVFHRFKVKLRDEIVSFGHSAIDPSHNTGVYLDAGEWNNLIRDPEVLLIDVRNHYEVDVGAFPNSVQPNTVSFRDFSEYVDESLDPAKIKKVAMYCTGGIRCEKASAFMLKKGFRHVYQLRGGILKYLETVEPEENLWEGECFVFDQRVSLDTNLQQGSYEQCFACRHPLSSEDLKSTKYEKGISCPHCIAYLTEAQKKSFSDRNHQLALAAERGVTHLGPLPDGEDLN